MPRNFAAPVVEQRDIHFDLGTADLCDWHPAGPQVSLYFAAFSPFFPEGEKFFIRSVRRFAEKVEDPPLRRDISGFIAQEAMHGREHRLYNTGLDRAGIPASAVENFVIRDLNWTERHFSAKAKLAMTIALEHLTAIMASVLLREPRALAHSDERVARLWRWHAIEETEHKAVAFELYQQVAPGWSGYALRCAMMLLTSVFFFLETFVVHLLFCWRAGCFWNLGGWMRAWWFLWGVPGVQRRMLRPWLAYFRPGFHPWDDDNRAEIERWKSTQSTATVN